MRKLVALVLAFAGISFAQQTQSGVNEGFNPEVLWEQSKEIMLRLPAMEKECRERSQSHDAFVKCISKLINQMMQGEK